MIRILHTLPLLVLLGLAPINNAAAADSENCAAINNANERLACFDRMFPRRNTTPPVPERTDTVTRPPVEEITEEITERPVVGKVEPEPEKRRGFGFPKVGDLFTPGDRENVESRIAEVRARDKQKMVFLLENDQIWIQSSPRLLPIREGEKVKVSVTTFGGYMMQTERGTTTRVNRIR